MTASRKPRASSRDAILRVFAEQVAEKGYSDTTIADVAAALHLSKGTIVHHYGSKDRLLSEVHAAYFQRRFAEVEFVLAELDDPTAQLAAVIYALLAGHRDDRAASLTFLREFVRYAEGGLSDHLRERRREYTQTVIEIIERGVEQGVFSSPDPSLTALQLFGMCNYAWAWYRPNGRRTIEEIAAQFTQTFLVGLSSLDHPTTGYTGLIDRAISVVQRAPGRQAPGDHPAASAPSVGRGGGGT